MLLSEDVFTKEGNGEDAPELCNVGLIRPGTLVMSLAVRIEMSHDTEFKHECLRMSLENEAARAV